MQTGRWMVGDGETTGGGGRRSDKFAGWTAVAEWKSTMTDIGGQSAMMGSATVKLVLSASKLGAREEDKSRRLAEERARSGWIMCNAPDESRRSPPALRTGGSSGPVACGGNVAGRWGHHDCSHSEDVGVCCNYGCIRGNKNGKRI
eukprot:764687-Hanusia_phi.AAC.3